MGAENKKSGGLMTVKEVAEYLGLAEGTIYQKVSKGQIPYVKLGRNVRFRKDDIDEWVVRVDAESKGED